VSGTGRWCIRAPVRTVTSAAAASVQQGWCWCTCMVKCDLGAVHTAMVLFIHASPVNVKLKFSNIQTDPNLQNVKRVLAELHKFANFVL
jgi:hypothetical protein